MARNFDELSEQEVLALAISLEETDARIYADFAEMLKQDYPATSAMFRDMQVEEDQHRRGLIDQYQRRFGDHIPLIRREDVRGFVRRKPIWMSKPLGINVMRRQAEIMELETKQFYQRAQARSTDPGTRKLLGDLIAAEERHAQAAATSEETHLTEGAKHAEEEAHRRLFVLQVVQPGLAGLMDGSVSTLAPLFAAAFATKSSHDAFLVGLAASVGAGISMGFAEALSDDGSMTGRGKPLIRGIVCGIMTTGGGIFHTIPYLIPQFRLATTIAVCIVACELFIISYIRKRYMDTPFLRAAFQVIVGGILVFLAGILIGQG